MKKRVPILVTAAAVALLALGPVMSASAWSSVVIPNKPADCGGSATGSSWYTSTQAKASTATTVCVFPYTMNVATRYVGGYNTPYAVYTNGYTGTNYIEQDANLSAASYIGGHHLFAGGSSNS